MRCNCGMTSDAPMLNSEYFNELLRILNIDYETVCVYGQYQYAQKIADRIMEMYGQSGKDEFLSIKQYNDKHGKALLCSSCGKNILRLELFDIYDCLNKKIEKLLLEYIESDTGLKVSRVITGFHTHYSIEFYQSLLKEISEDHYNDIVSRREFIYQFAPCIGGPLEGANFSGIISGVIANVISGLIFQGIDSRRKKKSLEDLVTEKTTEYDFSLINGILPPRSELNPTTINDMIALLPEDKRKKILEEILLEYANVISDQIRDKCTD